MFKSRVKLYKYGFIYKSFSNRRSNKTNKLTNIIDIDDVNKPDFVQSFKKQFPIDLNKKDLVKYDQNLSCFIPYEKVITQVKAVSLAKKFLDGLVINSDSAQIESLCEEVLARKILYNMETIKASTDEGVKYKIYFNDKTNLRKVNFAVNLYNIKNYILIGVDSNRKTPKNLKTITFYRDMHLSIYLYNCN